jgi:tetratricopeptide (TPR) repeat protein
MGLLSGWGLGCESVPCAHPLTNRDTFTRGNAQEVRESIVLFPRIAVQCSREEVSSAFGGSFALARTCGIPKQTEIARLLRLTGVLWLITVCIVNCLSQQTTHRESQRQSALTLEREGKVAEAEAGWRALLNGQSSDSDAYAHLGLLEARQEHYKEAIVLYHQALNLNPKIPGLRLNLGLSLFKAGELQSAIQTFLPLLKSEPKPSPEALRLVTLIGLAHYGLGDYTASVPYLKDAAAGDPQNVSLRMTLAESCLLSKQYQCVLDVYHEILTLNPDSAEAHMLAGEAYDELKNDDGAITEFEAAVKADPGKPNVHFGFGYALWRRLKFDDAEREFRSELANNPEHPLALAFLGDTEMRRNSLDDAVSHLEHAIRIQPSIGIAHLDLGILLEGKGQKEDALIELKKAEELNPGDSAIHYRLGRFYQSMGRKVEAKGEFEKAQSLLQTNQLSLREQMHQVDAKPAGWNAVIEPK